MRGKFLEELDNRLEGVSVEKQTSHILSGHEGKPGGQCAVSSSVISIFHICRRSKGLSEYRYH